MTTNTNTTKSYILRALRRVKKNGLTAGEIFDRVQTLALQGGHDFPQYSGVRARLVELERQGLVVARGARKDKVSGRTSLTFVSA